MRFSTLAALSIFTLAVQAISIPPSFDVARRSAETTHDLVPRCPTCGSGSGSGSGSTTAVDLSVFTSVQELTCLHTVVDTFISATVSLTVDIKADVIAKVIVWTSYSSADLAELDLALAALITSGVGLTDATYLAVLLKADVALDITVEEITCLRAFISAVLDVSIDLSASVKTYILNWCHSILDYTVDALVSLTAEIVVAINALTKVTVAASTSGVIDLRLKLITYVGSLISLTSKTGLLVKLKLVAILASLNLWIITSVVTGIDLKTCLSIIAQLNSCGYDVVTVLGLDLTVFGSLYTGVH